MKNIHIVFLCLSFSLFTAALAQDDFSDEQTETFTSISGTVTDASSGKPIAGAMIVDNGDLGGAADQDGKYTIDGITSGVSVTASAIGYEDMTVFKINLKLILLLTHRLLKCQSLKCLLLAPLKTAAAYTDVSNEEISLRLGSQDIPLAMIWYLVYMLRTKVVLVMQELMLEDLTREMLL